MGTKSVFESSLHFKLVSFVCVIVRAASHGLSQTLGTQEHPPPQIGSILS